MIFSKVQLIFSKVVHWVAGIIGDKSARHSDAVHHRPSPHGRCPEEASHLIKSHLITSLSDLHRFQPVLWIRFRICMVLVGRIRIQKGKYDPQKSEEISCSEKKV